jgi:hypothetical protein
MEIFNLIFVIVITVLFGWLAWETTIMVSEKKARYRAGTHDYHDNLIEEESDDIEEVKRILSVADLKARTMDSNK